MQTLGPSAPRPAPSLKVTRNVANQQRLLKAHGNQRLHGNQAPKGEGGMKKEISFLEDKAEGIEGRSLVFIIKGQSSSNMKGDPCSEDKAEASP